MTTYYHPHTIEIIQEGLIYKVYADGSEIESGTYAKCENRALAASSRLSFQSGTVVNCNINGIIYTISMKKAAT
jgi:hypothetical protein